MSAVIFGAGTYGEVYLHYLRDAGVEVVGFLDDNASKHGIKVLGVPVLGGSDALQKVRDAGVSKLYCPVGNNAVRLRVNRQARALGLVTPNFVHRSAVVDSVLAPGSGIYVFPGSVLMPFIDVRADVMISMGVKVAHHSTLEEGVFLSTGVSVGASMRLCERAYVGMSATLVTGKCVTVGAGAMIGAGAVVVSDVPADAVYAGVPAKMIKSGK